MNPQAPAGGAGLLANAGFAMLAKLLYLATRLGLPPLVLAHVTLAEYGLWAACFILIGYMGLADFGLSSVYVRASAQLHAANDVAAIGRLLSTGIGCMLLVALLLFAGLAAGLPAVLELLRVPAAQHDLARLLILGSSAVFLIDMTLNAFAYLLHGMNRFRCEQKVWVLAFLLEMLLIVAFLLAGLGIVALLAAFALRYAFSITCNLCLACRALPGLRVTPAGFDLALLRRFLGFGLGVQASTLLAMALHSADRLLAGVVLGPQAIALFDLGGKLPLAVCSVPAAISQATLPAAARLAPGDPAASTLYATATRSTAIIAALPLAFLAAFATPLCFAWLGPHAELAALPPIITLTALGAFMHIITGPGSAVFRGSGRIANEFVYHGLRIACLGGAVALSCSLLGTAPLPIATGLAAGSALAAGLYLAYNHRRLGLPLRHLALAILRPGALLFALAAALLPLWTAALPATLSRADTLLALAAFAALYGLLAGGALWPLLTAPERSRIAGLFRARLSPLRFRRSP